MEVRCQSVIFEIEGIKRENIWKTNREKSVLIIKGHQKCIFNLNNF
jgi:hypothetical protein